MTATSDIVHTLAHSVNDAFRPDTTCQKYMDIVNKVTSFFNQNQKLYMMLEAKQTNESVEMIESSSSSMTFPRGDIHDFQPF